MPILCLAACIFTTLAADSVKLTEDRDIEIVDSTTRGKFKKGTTVTLNNKGQVSRGTLASDQSFLISANLSVLLKGDFIANFSHGKTNYGYLAKNHNLFISGDVNNSYEFRPGYTTFNSKGEVSEGLLAKEQNFFFNGVVGYKIPFQAKQIIFNNKGQVSYGSIAKELTFMANGSTNPNLKLPADTIVGWNNKGQVLYAVLPVALKFDTEKGQMLFKKGSYVTFEKGLAVVPKTK